MAETISPAFLVISLNPDQKKILLATLLSFQIWTTQYFWVYLPGLFDLGIYFLWAAFHLTILLISFYQLYRYFTEKQKTKFRLINSGLIVLLSVVFVIKPEGLICFHTFEPEDYLIAYYEGVANCTTTLKLKEGNRFKETAVCFGTDHYWGEYSISNDTVRLYYDTIWGKDNQHDYVILELAPEGSDIGPGLLHYYSADVKRQGIPMLITTLKQDLLFANK